MQVKSIADLSPFIKLPFVIKTFVLSIFEWPFYTGFTISFIFDWNSKQQNQLHTWIMYFCILQKLNFSIQMTEK